MSNSRLEKFIYAICSMEVSDLPAPLSRIEILWNCLITGETPDFEPQSRNEQYLMAMLGLYELDQLQTPMSRGEKLLYKIAMGETDLSDIPGYLSRYEELLGYLAENGGVGDFEYVLQTLNQRLSTLYSTKEQPMKQAVIKGDTLVNELPRPSLKNTMMNAASQKLNQEYDNGKTLVNLVPSNYKIDWTLESTVWKSTFLFINSATEAYKIKVTKPIKPSTKYLIICNIKENDATSEVLLINTDRVCVFTEHNRVPVGAKGIYKCIMTTKDDLTGPDIVIRAQSAGCGGTGNSKFVADSFMLIEYQDGMENWDIPYFEGTKTFSATPNVVDGEFKQAVVKGQTLVNIINKENKSLQGIDITENENAYTVTGNGGVLFDHSLFKPSTIYTAFLRVSGNGTVFIDNASAYYVSSQRPTYDVSSPITIKFVFTTISDFSTLTMGVYNNRFKIGVEHVVGSVTIDKEIMVLEGDYTNSDIPYFEGMQSVQLSEVTTTGKNLFDVSKETKNITINLDSGLVDVHTTDRNTSDFIKVTPNTKYISNVKMTRIGYYDRDKNFITSVTNVSDGITIPSLGAYIRFSYVNSLSNVQFEQGSVATPYEPYGRSNTLTLAEPVTLRKVGDVEDEFDALTGQVTERVGEIVLDGSENWAEASEGDNINGFSIWIGISGVKHGDFAICDKLPHYPSNNDLTNKTQFISCPPNSIVFIVNIKGLTSLQEVKEWLSQNPITVQYKLATESTKTVNPTITDQDGATQTKLHSFNDGHLSVSSQGLLPSVVNYEVPTNNSYYLPDMLTLGAQYTSRGSADCNATIDGKLLALGKNRTFTTPSSLTNRLMVLDAPVDDLMFIEGDQTAKEFGYFEGMKSVVLSGIQVTGKNKFDGVSYIDGYIFGGGNTKVKPDSNVTSILVNLEKNTNYILSTKTSFDRSIIGGSTTPISINSYVNVIDCKKIDSRILFNSGEYTYFIIYLNNGKIELADLQVEKGSVATPYEPYKSTTLTLNEPVTLRKVGDVRDTLDCLTREVTERIGEMALDGSENWVYEPNYERFYIEVSDLTKVQDYSNKIICDDNYRVLKNYGNMQSYNYPTISGYYDSTNKYPNNNWIYVRIPNIITVEKMKQYFKENPLRVQYQLKTESIKTVDLTTVDQDGQPTKLKTFNDISYVEINADNLIPSVDVEVATKINEALSTMGPQQLDISNTQNKLGQTIDEQTENTDATMMATTEIYENL